MNAKIQELVSKCVICLESTAANQKELLISTEELQVDPGKQSPRTCLFSMAMMTSWSLIIIADIQRSRNWRIH